MTTPTRSPGSAGVPGAGFAAPAAGCGGGLAGVGFHAAAGCTGPAGFPVAGGAGVRAGVGFAAGLAFTGDARRTGAFFLGGFFPTFAACLRTAGLPATIFLGFAFALPLAFFLVAMGTLRSFVCSAHCDHWCGGRLRAHSVYLAAFACSSR